MSKNLKEAIRNNQKLHNLKSRRIIMVNEETDIDTPKKSKKSKKSTMLMAFAKGKETNDIEIKRYIGVGSFNVLGVNMSKSEIEQIYNRPSENEPNYLNELDINGKKVPQARIEFIMKDTNPETNLIVRKSYYIAKAPRTNKDNTKIQVIDKYGRTAWVTNEQLKNHEIPMYSNGPANLDKDYRPAYIGEELLTNFIIAYLGIPSVMKYNKAESKWYMVSNPEDSEARLECIEEYFKNNFKELKDTIAMQPTNKIKALVGIKNSNGKLYQDVYDMILKNSISDYSKLEKDLNDRKAQGAYPNTEFKICELKEYTVESTTFGTTETSNPFEQNTFDSIF